MIMTSSTVMGAVNRDDDEEYTQMNVTGQFGNHENGGDNDYDQEMRD